MRKTTIRNLIHFILIIIPILMLFICVLQPLKNADGGDITTDTHTETTITYGQTNEVTTKSSLVLNNYYRINIGDLVYDGYDTMDDFITENHMSYFECQIYKVYNFAIGGDIIWDDAMYSTMFYNSNVNLQIGTDYTYISLGTSLNDYYLSMIWDNIFTIDNGYDSYIFIKLLGYDNTQPNTQLKYIEECTITEVLPIESVTQQTIEGTRYNYDLIRPFETFYNLNVNSWYNDLLNLVGLENNSRISNYIFHYPLYLMWFFLLEIVEIVLTAVPRLLILICKKIGGDEV